MKTHQEIQDAICALRRDYSGVNDYVCALLDILHALNDRIEEVKEYACSVEKQHNQFLAATRSLVADLMRIDAAETIHKS